MTHTKPGPPLLLLLLLSAAFSCRKAAPTGDDRIVGTWTLREVYSGYVNGGAFRWHRMSEASSHTLTFTADGQFIRQENENGNFQRCTGTYTLNGDTLLLRSPCSTVPERKFVSERSPLRLILNSPGIEGVIRRKYTAGRIGF
ncbi:lipocalin family protein [Flaviaesturariibacter amylovorans]|uniref:Lipocalin-like domain-containing protein n=1 Tax=Flaviaesturariibacter amylovorans TaxID=1084520 RepID=A0ABP8GE91_9BACT